ncbi:MAG: sigma-70 family RNA polymerase sigma factor [Planctomycetota bacterium]|nr:MAG: sigma-70 family RNA polymerase sigma factor [Planctomycetota bacterium]
MSSVAPASTTPAIDINYELTKGFAARCIRLKAKRMMGHTSLKPADREDLCQDLSLAVLQALPNFDPQAGDWESFVSTVIERHAARLLIRRRADKRCIGNDIGSLDVRVQDAEGNDVSLGSQISYESRDSTVGQYGSNGVQAFEAAHDVRVMLESATHRTREICQALAETNEREVMERFGITRRTLRAHLHRLAKKHG